VRKFVFAAQLLEKQMGASPFMNLQLLQHPSVHSASDIMNERVLAGEVN
jgi:hypothetical protein